MIGASLAAAKSAQPKKRYFTAPDGTKYEWTKKGNPTQADVDAIVKYHETNVAPSNKAVAQGGKAVSDTLTGMFGPKTAKSDNVTSFFQSQNADKKTTAPINPKAIAAADKSMQLANRRNAKGQHLDTKGNVIPDYKVQDGIDISNASQKAITDFIKPVTDFLGGVVGEMSSANRVPGGREISQNLTGSVIGGIINSPIDLAANAGNMLFPIDNSPANIVRSGANIAAQVLPLEAIPGVKTLIKSGEGVADDFAKALGSAEGSGLPKKPRDVVTGQAQRDAMGIVDKPKTTPPTGKQGKPQFRPEQGVFVNGAPAQIVDLTDTHANIRYQDGQVRKVKLSEISDIPNPKTDKFSETGDFKGNDPEAPQKPVQAPETGNATGLANQVQDKEALNGIINEVEPTKGKGAEDWQGVGKKSVDTGEIDPEQLAARIGSGEEELTGKKVGALLEGKRKLMNALNSAKPGEEYLKAKEKLDTYLQNVQQGKGRWSDVGRALQAGTELDTGNFAQVIEAVQKSGGKLNPKMEQQFRDMTEKVKAAEAKLSETERLLKEEQAKRTTASQAKKSPRFSKEELDAELDSLLKEFGQKTAKLSAGIDPELLPIMGKIAVNYMKRGVNTLDEVVAAVQSHFKDATYEDVVSGIDAATKGVSRTKSDIQKEIARLKGQAKSDVKVRQQIESLREQLRTGEYEVPTKREATITKRLEDLRLEKGLLSNEVKSRIGATQLKTGWQTATNVLNAPKSIKSSVDISAAGRQGWVLGAANPDKIPGAFMDQLKAMASQKGALRAQNAILERPNASTYKRMGLYLAPLEGAGEEAFKGTVIPKWNKLNPFQGSSRAYTAYLNRMRADVADRLIKWAGPNATDDDLKVIGNYINVASGRGGKSIHLEGKIAESLNNVFFSPRFVASRFELALGQPLMTAQGKLGRSLKARGLVAQQYAATIGTVGSILALAKHMNPDMNTTDPTKPDYMSPKVGDTKIDVLAGLRQTINLGSRLLDKSQSNYDKERALGKFARSKLSPAAGTAISLYSGKGFNNENYSIKNALVDLVSPLSLQELVDGAAKDGWNRDDFLGLLNFLGFNTQTYKPKQEGKERPN